jgi:hypothetical protein
MLAPTTKVCDDGGDNAPNYDSLGVFIGVLSNVINKFGNYVGLFGLGVEFEGCESQVACKILRSYQTELGLIPPTKFPCLL